MKGHAKKASVNHKTAKSNAQPIKAKQSDKAAKSRGRHKVKK